MASEHGTNSRYTSDACRCADCSYAHWQYQQAWRAEQRRLVKLARDVEQAVRRSH